MHLGKCIGVGMVAALALATLSPATRGDDSSSNGNGTWIGVRVKPLSEGLREQWDYSGAGVIVTGVVPGSPAEVAGIARGDVLVVLGSVSLRSQSDFEEAQARATPGEPVSVVVARDRGRMIHILNLSMDETPTPATEPSAQESAQRAGTSQAAANPPEAEPAPVASRAAPAPSPTASAPAASPIGGAALASPIAPAPVAGAPAPLASASAPAPAVAAASPSFGARCEPLGSDLAAALDVPVDRGVVVLGVTSGSPADLAGIRAGDVITEVGGQAVATGDELEKALASSSSSSGSSWMRVNRHREDRDVEVRLAAQPTVADRSERDASRDREIQDLRETVRALRMEVRKLRSELEGLRSDSQ